LATTRTEEELAAIGTRLAGFLPPKTTEAAVISMLARLRCNIFSFADEAGQILGAGCYSRAAMFNHSCAPNCVVTYGRDGRLFMRTACEVGRHTELTHSYTDLCVPTHMRRRALHNQYGFICDCPRCVDGATTADGEDLDFVMEAAGGGDLDEAQVDRLMQASEEALARAESRGTTPAEAAKLVQQALQIRRQHCHPLSLMRYHAESQSCALSQRLGDDARARECGRNALAFLESALAHVPWHPSIAIDCMQQVPARRLTNADSRPPPCLPISPHISQACSSSRRASCCSRGRRRARVSRSRPRS